MKFKNLLVIDSYRLKQASDPETLTITTGELGSWVRSGKFLSHLFKYREACLLTFQHNLPTRPFLCALTLKLLSPRKCFFKDTQGTTQLITFSILLGLFFGFLKESIEIPFKLQYHNRKTKLLMASIPKNISSTLNLKYPPLYLRTDMIQGLLVGGSINHTVGVINNLHHFASNPVVVSTAHIPNLRSDTLHQVEPSTDNQNFPDIHLLEFSNLIYRQYKNKLKNVPFSFLYQRYSVYNYSGVLLAHHFDIPLITEYNGSETWVGRNWTQDLQHEQLAERIELLNCQAANVVTVVSQPLKDDLIDRGILPEKILVNPNGVDSEVYSPEVDGSQIRRKHHLRDKMVIGFIGTFGKWHGAEILAKGFGLLLQQYPQYRATIRLLMIGDGSTMPKVQKELEAYGVTQECILTGIVTQQEGPAYLAACDLLASPHVPNPDGTPFFGSPTKLFEYMAMGKGIVASDLEQIGEVLEHDGTAWLVKPGDAESLMLGLKTLIDNPQISKRLGEAARREVVAKYTWKEHTRKIIEKLKERCPCD